MKTNVDTLLKFISGTAVALTLLLATSCDYLDRAPDAGLSEEEVFSKYDNFRRFFDAVYYADQSIRCHFPLFFDGNDQKFTMYSLTDMSDGSRLGQTQPAKQGQSTNITWAVGYNINGTGKAAKVSYSWAVIRKANMAIEKIDMLKDASELEKKDLLAQAYFVRAFTHFEMFRFYGSLPYIDKALGSDDEWDLYRLSDIEMLDRIAADFQTAADLLEECGLMRRDPVSGAGHLAAADQDKPNGVAALAYKARALLYAASPLSNTNNDPERWKMAADACWIALKSALDNGFELLPLESYSSNFYGVKYTNEHIWTFAYNAALNWDHERLQGIIPYCFCTGSKGAVLHSNDCPTQNFVDKFETAAGGYPLNTTEMRAVATAAGEYNEQNPFENRDPRFYNAVVYNQKPVQGYGNASLYVNEDGSLPEGSLLNQPTGTEPVSNTYYYSCKRTGELSTYGVQNLVMTDPLIRLAELYLNYAEAVNEAYGPNGSAPGADITALQAVNIVRHRVNMPDVRAEYTANTDVFRDRIKNERTVELCFEGHHYYCDIRRWKDAPTIGRSTLYGLRPTRLASGPSGEYPTGFRYDRVALPENRQINWKNDGMYYLQFQPEDLRKMKNYVPNQAW